ncbi:MAG: CxxxxCH/CxxCH domain-containing protein [Deltaproteobacteria bacterium]|nr:CxxxxCH/CxxCH domain-containing protein [Deltaproteobacteria bacterium]
MPTDPCCLPHPQRLALAALLALAPAWGCTNWRGEAADTNPCASCHGSEARPGTTLQQAAPPRDLAGNTEVVFPGVGAHEQHLVGAPTHAPVRCDECHALPATDDAPGHADSALPAEVALGPLAGRGGRSPRYNPARRTCTDTYCHLGAEPAWTRPRSSAQACGSCHGLPPPPPHAASDQCYRCHGNVAAADGTFARPEWHADGVLDVAFTCHSCHGTEKSPAPPPDTTGSLARASLGVGAHEAHLRESARSLGVPCETCHAVPSEAAEAGHLDTTPGAEVIFSGVAVAQGRDPSWDREARRCNQVWCHGPEPAAAPSPEWTSTDGPLSCGGCHGYPPPPPHPPIAACGTCHPAVADGKGKIRSRALHIDGIVQIDLPKPGD